MNGSEPNVGDMTLDAGTVITFFAFNPLENTLQPMVTFTGPGPTTGPQPFLVAPSTFVTDYSYGVPGSVTLTATAGAVGDASSPITVDITNGALNITAGGEVNGISVDVNGTIAPTDVINLVGTPPGSCLLNGSPCP